MGSSIQRVSPTKPGLAPTAARRASALRTSSRKIDAERWLKVSEAETLTGKWVDPAAGEKLFVPYAEEGIAAKRSTVGETTATNTESLLRARVLPEFGDETLKQITTPAVRRWLAAMSKEGLAPSTVYTYRRALTQILDQAVDDGLLVTNPAKKAKAPAMRPRRQMWILGRFIASA